MKNGSTLFAWLWLAVALLAWAGVFFFAWTTQNAALAAQSSIADMQNAHDQQYVTLQTHVLAQTTAPARTQLEGALNTGVLSLVATMTTAGQDAGVDLQVSNAAPEINSKLPQDIGAIDFNVQASGTFAALVQAAALLETLPIPSSVTEIDIGRTPPQTGKSAKVAWQMNAQIRVLTTAQISS